MSSNTGSIVREAFMVTVHVSAETLSHPFHLLKTEVLSPVPVGVGTSDTVVPLA